MKVSVVTVTYNHAPYLAETIQSALAQETTFPFEIVLGEDCSTDGTREVAKQLAAQHPDRIRLQLPDSNLGVTRNTASTICAARGEYLAILEGDDVWTEPRKLQRQADYLDAHPECAWCFTQAHVMDAQGQPVGPDLAVYDDRKSFTLAELLDRQFQPRFCTVMFRRATLPTEFPEWFFEMPTADLPLFVFAAQHGTIDLLDEVTASYRIHAGGVWSQGLQSEEWWAGTPEQQTRWVGRLQDVVQLYEALRGHLGPAHREIIDRQIADFSWRVAGVWSALGRPRLAWKSAWKAFRAKPSLHRLIRSGVLLGWLRRYPRA